MREATMAATIGFAATALSHFVWYRVKAKTTTEAVRPAVTREKEVIKKRVFPEDITVEKMENDIDEFATSLSHYEKTKFYSLHHKLQEDVMIDTIPWLSDQRINVTEHTNCCGYLSMGMAFIFDVAVRMNKGEYHPEFDICVEESRRLVMEAIERLSKVHYALAARDLYSTANQLVEMIVSRHFNILNGSVNKIREREVAV